MAFITEAEHMRGTIDKLSINEGKYWQSTGKYQDESDELEKLVPSMGASDTLRGEITRAASKIYHDYFNNGFGNDWSEALYFLEQYASIPQDVINFLSEYATGTIYDGIHTPGVNADQMLEKLVDSAIEAAMKIPEDTPTPMDMLDVTIPDSYYPDIIEDDYGDGNDDYFDDEDEEY